jgi:DNA (cytosine-5)-methyltransferase 1
MKVFSLFTGVGGFELGMPKEWEFVGFSEIDKYASQVLRYRFPNIKNYGDVKKIKTEELPNFDLLTGGSPCQDLSIAGKRRGLAGARSSLFMEYIRILRDKKPRYFIWENVKGALSSNYGFDFAVVLNEFSEAGYSLWWQVLNAKDFGVPQNRERIFVIGFRNQNPKEIFFKRENSKETDELSGYTNNLTARYEALGTGTYVAQSKFNAQKIQVQNKGASQHYRVYGEQGLAPSLQSQGGVSSQTHPFVVQRQPLRFLERNQKNINGDYAFSVDTTNTGGLNVDGKIRKLMPIESERLMSFPDNWTKYGRDEKGNKVEIPDSQRYKMCGNGVVSNVIRVLIKSML